MQLGKWCGRTLVQRWRRCEQSCTPTCLSRSLLIDDVRARPSTHRWAFGSGVSGSLTPSAFSNPFSADYISGPSALTFLKVHVGKTCEWLFGKSDDRRGVNGRPTITSLTVNFGKKCEWSSHTLGFSKSRLGDCVSGASGYHFPYGPFRDEA